MIGYQLRAEFSGDVEQVLEWDPDTGEHLKTRTVPLFSGGVITIDDSRNIDVAKALEEGHGTILVDETDFAAIIRLEEFAALERVGVDQDEEDPADDAGLKALEAAGVTALREEANVRGVKLESGIRKDQIVAGLAELNRRRDAGNELVPSDTLEVTITTAGEVVAVEHTATEGNN